MGSRKPKPIDITLDEAEAGEILAPSGGGGHQDFHERIRAELADGNRVLLFDDPRMGELLRYMSYGNRPKPGKKAKGGGFQTRLRKTFGRSLKELLRI